MRPHCCHRLFCSLPECPGSPEMVAKVAKEILAAKNKEIEELRKALGKVKMKPEPIIGGLYGNKDGTIVRAVYKGTGKSQTPNADQAYFTWNPGGNTKKYLKTEDKDNWKFMEEDEVKAAVAEHEAKMAALKNSSPAK